MIDCLFSFWFLRFFFASNACSAIKKEVCEKFRFNEEIIMSEDQEIARRILKAGYEILYEPEAAVYHSHNYPLKTYSEDTLTRGNPRAMSQKPG
ncbi:MAG: hypothetical protein AOA65_1630 [Candidatus Bathyarchaeota archaeon BA1]|nr:MAG: hypothetical protein AOA65_1630 [Candidatus Bathyarchaeota archaeon BA1]